MKKLETFTGGHPINVDDLDHLNEAIVETNADVAVGLGVTGIMWGIIFSGSGTISWSAGAVIHNGELFRVAAGSAVGTTSSLKVLVVVTDRAGNPIPYFDGNNRNVHHTRTVTFSTGGTGASIATLDALRFGNLLSERMVLHNAWVEVEDGSMTNSWLNYSAGNKLAYRKMLGYLELKGSVKSGTLYQPIFQLPATHRPATDRMMVAVKWNSGGGSTPTGVITGTIGSTGEITFHGSGTFSETFIDMNIRVPL